LSLGKATALDEIGHVWRTVDGTCSSVRCAAADNEQGEYIRSGIVPGIDPSYLIEVARRVSGLNQAELARRGGTSQATISAYERGLKAPSIKVAARLLAVMGWELTLRSRIDFEEYHPKGIVAFWAPNQLWRVPTPDCFAILKIPDLLRHTSQDEWDLADRSNRLRAYEILIRRGLPQQMIRWLDGGFLVDLWEELDLPGPVRKFWTPAIEHARRGRLVYDTLSWGPEDPETARLARIRGYEPLPPSRRGVRQSARRSWMISSRADSST
jgi:transcriptional regulator with XRE-family HTH domain